MVRTINVRYLFAREAEKKERGQRTQNRGQQKEETRDERGDDIYMCESESYIGERIFSS
jgi:hypothetical protein